MKFAYITKSSYAIGQIIEVHGRRMQVESYSHTGRNVVAHSLPNAKKFERILCIVTDADTIAEIPRSKP